MSDALVRPSEAQQAVDDLGDQIAELSAHIEAAQYRLLCMIRQFDEAEGWARAGAVSCAHWLSWRIGLGPVAAREKVRVARALTDLPKISAALEKGIISYSKTRAVTRVATPDNEEELLTFAEHGTAAQVEKVVRTYRRATRAEQLEKDNLRHDQRFLNTRIDDSGMLLIEGCLPPETAALFLKALEQAEQQLPKPAPDDSAETSITPPQKRADALGLMARASLESAATSTSADHTQIVVHVDAEALADDEAPGICCIENTADVSAETSRRLACDAAIVKIHHDADGNVLDVGRKTRTIPPAIRRALNTRDNTCRFPGCTHDRHLAAHHIRHWAQGGSTKLDNLIHLCSYHHRLVHEGGFAVKRVGEEITFHRPDGAALAAHPPPIHTEPATSMKTITSTQPNINADTMTTWNGDLLDYAWAIDILLHAHPS